MTNDIFSLRWGMLPQGIAFQNSDPRPAYFDPIIQRLQDFGVMDFFFRRHMPPRGMKENIVEPEEPLVIEHLYLPLIFWTVSLVVSLTLFVFEQFFLKCNNSRHSLKYERTNVHKID